MANDYREFCEVLSNLREDEEVWLKEQLAMIYVFGDREYAADALAADALPAGLDPDDADWFGQRVVRDLEGFDGHNPSFAYEFRRPDVPDTFGQGRYLLLQSDEWGDPALVAHLVRKFLAEFRTGDCWHLSYAIRCDAPQPGAFGGGALFVTADEVLHESTSMFLSRAKAEFHAGKRHRAPDTAPRARACDMKLPDELPCDALRDIVARVQGTMYLDRDADGREYWDPRKFRGDAELHHDLQEILGEYGLVPDRVQDASSAGAADELLAWAETLGLSDEALDEELHDQADSIVSDINNQGTAAQIEFLIAQLGVAETRKMLERLASDKGRRC